MSAKITYSRRLSQRKDEARTRKRRRLEEEDTDVDDPTSPKPVVTYLSRTPSSSGRTKSFQDLARSSTPPQLDSSRPSSPAKDISALFASTFSSSSSSSPSPKRGVAKRMLSRSRTEPTIPSPTRTPRASGSMGSVLSQSPSRSPQQSLSPSKPPTTDYLSARPPKRTYAGKSRSFLVALPVSALPEVQDDDELRESYTDLRARWGIEDSDDIELTMPGASSKGKEKSSAPVPTSGLYNDLKSITDLRSRGESRRFLDELGYLFEGLEGGEGVKRGSLLDLTTRLCQPSFSRRARAADLGPRVWDLVGRDRDLILTPTLALFTTITVRDSPALEEFDPPARAETVSFLFSLLSPSPSLSSSSARSETRKAEGKDEAHGGQVDPLWMVGCAKSDAEMRRAGLGRGEVAMVKRLHALIQDKSGLIGEGTIISTRLLASLALTSLSPALIPSTRANLSALRSVVSTDVSGLQRRVDAYISGASFRGEEEAGEVEWGYIAHLLVLLDSYFLGRWGSPAGDEDEDGDGRWEDEMKEELVNELVMVLVSVGVARREGEGAANAEIDQTTDLALRILVNLSHSNPQICSALLDNERTVPAVLRLALSLRASRTEEVAGGNEEAKEGQDEGESARVDRVCLALAFLTNLVQGDARARDVIRQVALNPACPSSRPCTFSCTCAAQVSGVECLSSLFPITPAAEDDCDLGTQFLHGHLAILLGLLMQNSLANRTLVLSNRAPAVLDCLMRNGKNLVVLHDAIAKGVERKGSSDNGAEVEEDGKEANGESTMNAMQDVQHVLSFLQELMVTSADQI